ncbi:hypothetical protein D3C72_2529470 [compost metagenome]
MIETNTRAANSAGKAYDDLTKDREEGEPFEFDEWWEYERAETPLHAPMTKT